MKKLLLILTLALLPAVAAAEDSAPERYYVPPGQFNAALEVMDLGFANVFGLFRNATASFAFEPATKTVDHLRLALDETSLVANSAENEHDLMMLLGAQYPEISFATEDSVSFTEGKADIRGVLTIHGISKPFVFEAVLNRIGKSPQGGGMWSDEGSAIGLSLRGTLKRADFGMADDPLVKSRFGDTVTLLLEMQAIKQ
jgi:polyisoprenoid-binding protein YceI